MVSSVFPQVFRMFPHVSHVFPFFFLVFPCFPGDAKGIFPVLDAAQVGDFFRGYDWELKGAAPRAGRETTEL